MSIFTNMKVRVKIIGAFSMLCISLTIVGYYGILNVGKISELSKSIYNNNYNSTVIVQNFSSNISSLNLYTEYVVTEVYKDKQQDNIEKIDSYKSNNNELN